MTYSPEEKKRIEKVLAAFSEYIRNSESIDFVFSKKLGFAVLCPETAAGDGTFCVVDNYDDCLNKLYREVTYDGIIQGMEREELVAHVRAVVEPILDTLGEDKEYCLKELKKYLKQ